MTNNISFTGIYKLPFNEKNLKEVSQYAIPMYKYLRRDAAVLFPGETPNKCVIDECLKQLAEKSGGSKEWLIMNAKNHNLNVDLFENNVFHVISGESDILQYTDYLKKRLNKKLTLQEKIKKLFSKKEKYDIRKELPDHLNVLRHLLNTLKKENDDFAEFAKGKIIEANDSKELLQRMLCER